MRIVSLYHCTMHYVSLYLYIGVNPFPAVRDAGLLLPPWPHRSPAVLWPFSLCPHHDQINTVRCRARLQVIMKLHFSQCFLLSGVSVLLAPHFPCPLRQRATFPGVWGGDPTVRVGRQLWGCPLPPGAWQVPPTITPKRSQELPALFSQVGYRVSWALRPPHSMIVFCSSIPENVHVKRGAREKHFLSNFTQ